MSDNEIVDAKTRASDLVNHVLDQLRDTESQRTREPIRLGAEPADSVKPLVHLSESQLGTLLDAVEQDLRQPCGNGRFAEEREAIVHARTRVLAEAVIAIETDQNYARTARALNAGLPETAGPSAPADVAAPPAT